MGFDKPGCSMNLLSSPKDAYLKAAFECLIANCSLALTRYLSFVLSLLPILTSGKRMGGNDCHLAEWDMGFWVATH